MKRTGSKLLLHWKRALSFNKRAPSLEKRALELSKKAGRNRIVAGYISHQISNSTQSFQSLEENVETLYRDIHRTATSPF